VFWRGLQGGADGGRDGSYAPGGSLFALQALLGQYSVRVCLDMPHSLVVSGGCSFVGLACSSEQSSTACVCRY
jgi:hypothetical protein